MKHLKAKLAAFGAFAISALPVSAALAQTTQNPFTQSQKLASDVGSSAGIASSTPLPLIVGRIVNVVLGFLGVVFLVLLLYAGFTWMTAQGDSKKVDTAKNIITQAIIGLVVIVAGFAISNFVLGSLVNVTQ